MASITSRTYSAIKNVLRPVKTTNIIMPKMPKITKYDLSTNCYIQKAVVKTSITVHHTAGNANPRAVVDGYAKRTDKVSTPYVIGGKPYGTNPDWVDGEIVQCFPENQCSYHLGMTQKHFTPFGLSYKELNFSSIAIEICNWGSVAQHNGKFYAYMGTEIPADEVILFEKPFRTHAKTPFFDSIGVSLQPATMYHKYTDAQLLSLRELLIYLCAQYKIPTTYHTNIFEVNKNALSGENGIWSHVSVRPDKIDCSPQPNFIRVLQTLSSI